LGVKPFQNETHVDRDRLSLAVQAKTRNLCCEELAGHSRGVFGTGERREVRRPKTRSLAFYRYVTVGRNRQRSFRPGITILEWMLIVPVIREVAVFEKGIIAHNRQPSHPQ
jgi:hypothetical protein